MFLLILFILPCAVIVNSFDIDFNFQDNISDGERRYGELVKKADSYGDCWKKAISDFHLGCKRLTEEVQSRLALNFANCFLRHAGSDPCPCAPDVPISECLKNSTDRVFSTYTEFFTHTQSICHYLQYKEWQEEASKTVLLLVENSQAVSRKLDESSKFQSKILNLQQAAVYEQKRLISNNRILNTELQQSKDKARDLYNEFKISTHEQKLLLFEVFDRMKTLQNFILGEFTGVYTVVYYIIAAAFTYILTSVPQTAGARIWLILLISLSAVSERIVTTYTLKDDLLSSTELLYCRIWLCRKIAFSVGFIIFTTSYYCYKDYNIINNQLLQEIHQQNKELQSFIKGLSYQENIQNFSTVLNSNKHSSILYEHLKEEKTATRTGIGERESDSSINMKNIVISQHILLPEKNQNKENIPLSSIPTTSLAANIKKSSRKIVHQKKTTYVRSQGNTPTVSLHAGNPLSELESPVSKRYNLRSSSRLNSPQSTSLNGISSKDTSLNISDLLTP